MAGWDESSARTPIARAAADCKSMAVLGDYADWIADGQVAVMHEARQFPLDRRAGYLKGEASMSEITLRVNGETHTLDVDPSTPLLYVLRNDLGLRGPRFGCGLAQCGTCTVLMDGRAIRSCNRPVSRSTGEITTLEGLPEDGELHPVQQAWIDEQVPQCGYCQNGQILTAAALLSYSPDPSDAEIREGMNRVLCRCMTYYRIQSAVKRAAQVMAEGEDR